jgi:uncharacterized membrane protein YoaK (UPF0700 family)
MHIAVMAGFKNGGRTTRQEGILIFLAGLLLCLNSGYINGCCMSGLLSRTGSSRIQPVSAFTGTYTKSALNLAGGNVPEFGFHVSMILCFIGGAYLSGLMNPNTTPFELSPSYGPTFLVGSVFMVASSIFAWRDPEGKGLYFCAAAANGVQNGITSMYTSNLIRTTHLTGTSTDIGLILGQMTRGNWDNAWKCGVLCSLAASFWFGGIMSFFSTQYFDHCGLYLAFSAVLFLVIGVGHLGYIMVKQNVTLCQAIMGRWQWKQVLQRSNDMSKDGTSMSEQEMLAVFDQIDEDSSGTLEVKKLYQAMISLNINVSCSKVFNMVKISDENRDGVIGKGEFLMVLVWLFHNRALDKKRRKEASLSSNLKLNVVGSVSHMNVLAQRTLHVDGNENANNDRYNADINDIVNCSKICLDIEVEKCVNMEDTSSCYEDDFDLGDGNRADSPRAVVKNISSTQ